MIYNQATIGKHKVAIIGSGFVGSSIAYALTIQDLAREIVLIDKDAKKAEGEAMDIRHGISHMGIATVYAGDYSDCANCDLIVITAGRNRRAGENRRNLIEDNTKIMQDVVRSVEQYYTNGVILIVSNPVDILTMRCAEWTGLPNGKVLGTGNILDTSRLIREVADYVNLNIENIKGFVIGEHGDAQIPIWSRMSVASLPISEYCDSVNIIWDETVRNCIAHKVQRMGANIIANKGRTHYGIATCVCFLAGAILNKSSVIASVSTPLEGEYGLRNVSLSLPSIIGANGVERRLLEHWTDEETQAFINSGKQLKEALGKSV